MAGAIKHSEYPIDGITLRTISFHRLLGTRYSTHRFDVLINRREDTIYKIAGTEIMLTVMVINTFILLQIYCNVWQTLGERNAGLSVSTQSPDRSLKAYDSM